MGAAAATGAVVLFLSQPLLWGHAFINPKDIPYMALFAGSILSGLSMFDRLASGRRTWPLASLASILLGLTASVRVIGPLAGLIVAGYGLLKLRKHGLPLLLLYGVGAAATGYVTWPYLWSSPIAHYIETVLTMSEFPFAPSILYWGNLYKANTLPRSYFPTLLALQLTEPMLVLLVAGLAACAWLWIKKQQREPAGLFLAWSLAPALLVIGMRTPIYDNGRQLYFVLPPLFLLAGLALDRLFAWVRQPAAKAVILLLAALPGVLLSVVLHPYEYTYYNALVGGTGGAFRKFETDYWGTSYKAMSEYLNETAPRGARVLVYGPQQIVEHYVRQDITAAIPSDQNKTGFQYALFLTRANLDQRRCNSAHTVYEIGRRGAVFATLKAIPQGAECR